MIQMANHFYQFLLFLFIQIFTFSFSFGQEWVQLNDPPFQKHHSNGFGIDGKAYIIEGVYQNDGPNQVSNEVWMYTAETDTWIQLEDFPGEARAIAIGDDWNGKYYYGFGDGSDERLNDLWEFDPNTETFTQLPSCPCQGRTHPAFIAHNDKIFMGSGSTGNGDLKDWWVYDMTTQIWTQKPDIPGDVRHHPFFFSIDDYVYVGGGHAFNWLRYDPVTEEWSPISNYPEGRVAGTQFQHNGYGYVLAGDDAYHDHVPVWQTFIRYNQQTNDWEELPPLPNGSRWAPSSFIIDDEVYYFNGLDFDDLSDASMWKFNLMALDNPTSNVEIEQEESIQIFPNPTSTFVEVQLPNADEWNITVLNPLGQTISTSRNNGDTFTFDMSKMAKGIYLFSFRRDGGATIMKKVQKN